MKMSVSCKIDEKGRISLPQKHREILGCRRKPYGFFAENNMVILQPESIASTGKCDVCWKRKKIRFVFSTVICKACFRNYDRLSIID